MSRIKVPVTGDQARINQLEEENDLLRKRIKDLESKQNAEQKPKQWDLQKLLIIGDSSVGKTLLASTFCKGGISHDYDKSTIGMDFMPKQRYIDDRLVKFQIWDTAGQERFKTITPQHWRYSDGILFVYDICNKDSFKNMQLWFSDFKYHSNDSKIPKCLVGNKSDMERNRTVSREAGEEFAINNGMRFFETSAKLFRNVDEAFLSLAADIRAFKERQPMAIFSEERIELNKSKKSKGGCCNIL